MGGGLSFSNRRYSQHILSLSGIVRFFFRQGDKLLNFFQKPALETFAHAQYIYCGLYDQWSRISSIVFSYRSSEEWEITVSCIFNITYISIYTWIHGTYVCMQAILSMLLKTSMEKRDRARFDETRRSLQIEMGTRVLCDWCLFDFSRRGSMLRKRTEEKC